MDVNTMMAFLHARQICERKDLISAQQVEIQEVLNGLRNKHDAQAQAQYDQHMSEVDARWQELNGDNEELVKRLSALHNEKHAKEKELARIEMDIERERKVLQSMPNMWQAIEGEIEGDIACKRMRMNNRGY
jgi:DNA repair exonuclease SbcCD ATPase subunit